MIKELLQKKYPEVAHLNQNRYLCLSNLPKSTKKKICRSWVRGSDAKWMSCYYGIPEEDIKVCIQEIINMARALGDKKLINLGVRETDGYVYMVGEMLQHWQTGDLRKELGYQDMKEVSVLRERFEELTGIPPKLNSCKSRRYFKWASSNTEGLSPLTGEKMKVLDSSLQMSKELKMDGMDFNKVGELYYCMTFMREYFAYDGDDNGNEAGLYEVAYEYLD